MRIRPVDVRWHAVVDHVREHVRVDDVALAEQQEDRDSGSAWSCTPLTIKCAGDALGAEVARDDRVGDGGVVERDHRAEVAGAQLGQQRRELGRLHAVGLADEGVDGRRRSPASAALVGRVEQRAQAERAVELAAPEDLRAVLLGLEQALIEAAEPHHRPEVRS